MARIQVVSDLHTEFWGPSSLDTLDPVDVDALVCAGDLGSYDTLAESLERLARRYSELPVVYVLGNHELYGASPARAHDTAREVAARNANLHVLDASSVTVAGVTFAGGTLWFPHDPACDRYRRGMSDFEVIEGLEPWCYEQNAATIAYLAGLETAPDVIVTHHIPTQDLVQPKWRSSKLNRFFVGDADAVLATRPPKVWVFGHTHDPVDRVLDGVRYVCNPKGYPGEGVPFDRRRIVTC